MSCNHEHRLDSIERKLERIMATLQDVLDKVTKMDTVEASLTALLAQLTAEVKALKPNQAAIDALAAKLDAQAQAMTDAVVANTEAAA